MQLQRITTEYIPVEDRIRLTGTDEHEQTVVLWLTQRLLGRLLPLLFNWLETQSPIEGASSRIHSHKSYAEAVQSFEQAAATAAQEAEAPVVAESATHEFLVEEVDIVSGAGGVKLIFKQLPGATSEQAAALILTTPQLRQWLSILYRHYDTVGWPLSLWPAWMAKASTASANNSVALH